MNKREVYIVRLLKINDVEQNGVQFIERFDDDLFVSYLNNKLSKFKILKQERLDVKITTLTKCGKIIEEEVEP